MKKNVIVLGKGTLAIKVANWFNLSPTYSLIGVVPQIPEPSWTESLAVWGRDHNIFVVESGDYKDFLVENKKHIHLVVSVFYDKIIKNDLITCADKLINIHNSPLPKYRGVKPIHWALKNNEKTHGVTIHEITKGIDDGPIISQLNYSIFPELEEVIDVYKKSIKFAWLLFEETIPYIWNIVPVNQNEEFATYYSKKDDSALGDRLFISRKLQKR